MAGCPSSHQPTRIREETLESGGPLQPEVEFPPPYLNKQILNFPTCDTLLTKDYDVISVSKYHFL